METEKRQFRPYMEIMKELECDPSPLVFSRVQAELLLDIREILRLQKVIGSDEVQ